MMPSPEEDQTVDEMNPLGVTQVTYDYDMPAFQEILSGAASQYRDLSHKFEEITQEIQVDIIEAKDELTASMDKILL